MQTKNQNLENPLSERQNVNAELPPAQNSTSSGSSGRLAPASCSAASSSEPFDPAVKYKGGMLEGMPKWAFTEEGKFKMRVSQNNPVLLENTDGLMVQLAPDNWRPLVGQWAEVEFLPDGVPR